MNEYNIFETDNFLKELEKISRENKIIIKNKLLTKIYPQLKIQSQFGNNIKKLKYYSPGTCRYRIGNYRIFYEISNNDRIVHIIGISIRQAAY